MNSRRVYLLDKDGNVQYGLNWGRRDNREPNQAYLQLESEVYNTDFFPTKGTYFLVSTDDGDCFALNRAQKTESGTALQSPENNSIIGLFLRKRLGLSSDVEITKDAILDYGRIDILFTKIDNRHFILDFSQNWHSNDFAFVYQSYLTICKRDVDYKQAVFLGKNVSEKLDMDYPYLEEFKSSTYFQEHYIESIPPLQRIFYGAPGTGKSHGIKGQEPLFSKVIRTTFHPDSDYSTFVGAYKPTMEECEVKVTPVVINNGISLDQNNGTYKEKRITYSFVKQAFLKAYIEAWNRHDKGENVLLVIEEINRGNCAQIFGDLFQLLDRNDEGYSDYPIQADEDIRMVLADEFVNLDNIPENVKSGEELLLPNNLYIWATMNTSDQSLFPIDSAFKRRWDWEYMKIKNENKNWKIDIKQGVENVDWWVFVQKINTIIASMTSSADKQLGYFFCKADKKANGADAEPTIISAKAFVGKVLFYLWNDVFKDTGFEDESLFTYEEAGKKTELTFPDFYGEDGKDVDTERVADFINRVMAWQKQEENV